jgi:hypothetical protein
MVVSFILTIFPFDHCIVVPLQRLYLYLYLFCGAATVYPAAPLAHTSFIFYYVDLVMKALNNDVIENMSSGLQLFTISLLVFRLRALKVTWNIYRHS